MIEGIGRLVKYYIVRGDRCDLVGGEADHEKEAILRAREQGFVMEPHWNGSGYSFTVLCPGCYEKITRRAEGGDEACGSCRSCSF
jgi:hypothetical protein